MDNDRLADRHSTVYFPLSTLSAVGRPPPPPLLHSVAFGGTRRGEKGEPEVETFRHPVTRSPCHPYPPPPLRDIRGHWGTFKKRGRGGAGEQRRRPCWHFGIGVIAFLALLATRRFNSGAPSSDSAGLSSDFFSTSSNFFETFGAFFRRSWEAKPRYPAGNEGDAGTRCGLVFDVTTIWQDRYGDFSLRDRPNSRRPA
jgi:hypothetical protein